MINKTGETLDQNRRKQFDLEKYWRKKILESDFGNERNLIIEQAYSEVYSLMNSYTSYDDSLIEKAMNQFPFFDRWLLQDKRIKFLDIGCSGGSLVLEALSNNWDAYGLDIEEASIRLAKDRLKIRFPKIDLNKFHNGDIYSFSVRNFDLIFHSDVLEHIHPLEALGFMKRIWELLDSKGTLVVNTPYRLCGPKDISKYFLTKGSKAEGLHLKEYLLVEMYGLYKKVGYTGVQAYLFHPKIHPILSKFFGVNQFNFFFKLGLEQILLLVNRIGLRKVSNAIAIRMFFSLTIGKK